MIDLISEFLSHRGIIREDTRIYKDEDIKEKKGDESL